MTDFALKQFPDLDPINEADIAPDDEHLVYDASVGVPKRVSQAQLNSGRITVLDSVASFANIALPSLSNRQPLLLKAFSPDGSRDGANLQWDSSIVRTMHDGKNFYSPTVPAPTDFDDPQQVQDYFDGVGEAWPEELGVFVRAEFREQVTPLSDITSLSSLNASALVDGQQFSVGSYLPNTSTGSALLRWRPDLPKSRHDGVLFFSLTVPMFTGTDTEDYRNGAGETDSSGNGVMELVRGEIIYDTTVLVPSHYDEPQDALASLAGRTSFGNESEINILMESGYQPAVPIVVEGGNYSRYRLTSSDAVVVVHPSFPSDGRFLTGFNSTTPQVACLIDLDGRVERGINLFRSDGHISSGSGFINASDRNAYCYDGSHLSGSGSILTGSLGRAVWVTRNSSALIESADVSGSNVGVYCARESEVRAISLIAQNVGPGVVLQAPRGASISAPMANFDGCTGTVASAGAGSRIVLEGSTGAGLGGRAILAARGGVFADDCEFSASAENSSFGIETNADGHVSFSSGKIEGFPDNVLVDTGTFFGHSSQILDAGRWGVRCQRGGQAKLRFATVTGSGTVDVSMADGGQAWMHMASTSNGAGAPDVGDVSSTSAFNTWSNSGIVWA